MGVSATACLVSFGQGLDHQRRGLPPGSRRRVTLLTWAAMLIGAAVSTPAFAANPAKTSWVGLKVVLKDPNTPLKVGKDVVGSDDVFRVYVVRQEKSPWLWVTSRMVTGAVVPDPQEGGIAGWVKEDEVVPFDQALDYYGDELKKKPNANAYLRRGFLHEMRGEYDEAIADYTRAIDLEPGSSVGYNDRGNAWSAKRDFRKAVADFDKAVALNPDDPLAYNNRGGVWLDKKEYDKAIVDFDKAIKLDPKHAVAFANRGIAWHGKKQYQHALADFETALSINPSCATAHNGLAWLLATCPDEKVRDAARALEAAERACELCEWNDPFCLGSLAAAHAEKGDFEEAARRQTKAIALLTDPAETVAFARRLAQYLDKKPWRE